MNTLIQVALIILIYGVWNNRNNLKSKLDEISSYFEIAESKYQKTLLQLEVTKRHLSIITLKYNFSERVSAKKLEELEVFTKIQTLSDALLKVKTEISIARELSEKECSELMAKHMDLVKKYDEDKDTYDKLLKKTMEYEENIEYMSFGLYQPHFSYSDSKEFKEELTDLREDQRTDIQYELAWSCDTNWTVNDSYKKGEIMTKRQAKLMIRAFNGECDAAMAKVRWNNALLMENRITKSFAAINKLGKSSDVEITDEYCKKKVQEFRLYHEFNLKVHEEKERKREIRAAEREETKLKKDIEVAVKKADADKVIYEQALSDAKEKLRESGLIDKQEVEQKIIELENALTDALERKQRALSQAQLTRSGHVYIISNIGCFGKDFFKIGMTRRLEPLDRVLELSGASVPFPFDVHGMIYSEDAPSLENKLHHHFSSNRINKVNSRKEFFNITLAEIQSVIESMGFELILTDVVEARQYRETMAVNESTQEQEEYLARMENEIPDRIYPMIN